MYVLKNINLKLFLLRPSLQLRFRVGSLVNHKNAKSGTRQPYFHSYASCSDERIIFESSISEKANLDGC